MGDRMAQNDTKRIEIRPKSVGFGDATRYTGLSESYLRLEVARRRLPVVRVGRATRLLLEDLDRYLMARRMEAR